MLYFRNDYSTGAHPRVLQALAEAGQTCYPGYGEDPWCERAADTIRALCRAPEARVHFLTGGTQVNRTVIGALLRPWEAVVAAASGHICGHEAGAVERDGHKILALPAADGKLTPAMVEAALTGSEGDHTVLPRLVYISNTTELGTVYTRAELGALSALCRERGLLLYCDGARLGAAMAAPGSDAGFADYAALCDAFTIGGTKNGLLFGEALVLPRPDLCPAFRRCMKQQGAMLAKGWLLGLQFETALRDGLYLDLARRAGDMAALLRRGLLDLGIPLLADSPSNQLFPILPRARVEALRERCAFEVQEALPDDRICIRLVTAWTTTEAEVAELLDLLRTGKEGA